MNFPGNETAGPADLSRLEDQCRSLRQWLTWVLALVMAVQVLLIVVSGTFTIYLLRLSRTTSKELAGFRPQATQMIAEYQKVSAPAMTDFLKKISDYGRTHPDFAPVLAKYGLKPGDPTGAAPAAATAPRAVPPKK